jgi:hypothetical protein
MSATVGLAVMNVHVVSQLTGCSSPTNLQYIYCITRCSCTVNLEYSLHKLRVAPCSQTSLFLHSFTFFAVDSLSVFVSEVSNARRSRHCFYNRLRLY